MNRTADSTTTQVTQDKSSLETFSIKQHSYSTNDVRKEEKQHLSYSMTGLKQKGDKRTILVSLEISTHHVVSLHKNTHN